MVRAGNPVLYPMGEIRDSPNLFFQPAFCAPHTIPLPSAPDENQDDLLTSVDLHRYFIANYYDLLLI